ncbi:hypothetical protein ASPVEDRAFT_429204 [Aspergillus versicolor CBS 583.65]|uniref:Secreted protein n=1 Tax=Aspergillus versicolor CBS 583.65 TaxID=1036611 RepID=A0A1L9P8H6_ASPVE|nr:uncharacterized protein ASPVEDRAFT_429204 [Aspergillus versicolor CBS 583.65]OJI97795.1 hypothetical protein ASPVEDRAFT_429204 [Aspergillus versicolor CBS 583.65]
MHECWLKPVIFLVCSISVHLGDFSFFFFNDCINTRDLHSPGSTAPFSVRLGNVYDCINRHDLHQPWTYARPVSIPRLRTL